jgi:hypothetical protein
MNRVEIPGDAGKKADIGLGDSFGVAGLKAGGELIQGSFKVLHNLPPRHPERV